MLFSTTLKIIRLLNEFSVSLLKVHQVTHEIKILSRLWPSVSFLHISMSYNVEAHCLAHRVVTLSFNECSNNGPIVDLYFKSFLIY